MGRSPKRTQPAERRETRGEPDRSDEGAVALQNDRTVLVGCLVQCLMRFVGDHVVFEQDPPRVIRSVAVVPERFVEQAPEHRRVV